MLTNIIKRLTKPTSSRQQHVVIHLATDAIRLAVYTASSQKNEPHLQSVNFSNGRWQEALTSLLADLPKQSHLHLILAADRYQLVQLDKPDLQSPEMLQALPWLVKDLVTVPPEDMVVDYIELPVVATQPAKISVVVAAKSQLSAIVNMIDAQNMSLLTIQPEEWLLPSLLTSASQAAMLVVHQPDQELLIQIVKDGILHFSRRARGFNQLHLCSAAQLRNEVIEPLLLELQRSMDYFESQLKQPPVRDIRLVVAHSVLMCELFAENGFNRTEPLVFKLAPAKLTSEAIPQYSALLGMLQRVTAEAAI